MILKFYKHVINYGLGSALPRLIGFLLIPLYIRYLTPEDYGILEIAGSISAFAMGLMHLKIPGSLTRYYYDYCKDNELLNNLITTIRKLVFRVSVLNFVILLTALFFLSPFFFPGFSYWPYIPLVIATVALGANSNIQSVLLQNREKSRYFAVLKTSFALVGIGLSVLFVVGFQWGPLGVLLASFIVGFVFYIQATYYLNTSTGRGLYDKTMARKALNYGLALSPAIVAADAALLYNKSLLLQFEAMEAVGIYSLAYRFFLPLDLLANATNTALTPKYNQYRKEGNQVSLVRVIRSTLITNITLFTLYMLFVPLVMTFMLTGEYLEAKTLISFIGITFIGKTMYHLSIAEVFYQIKVKFMAVLTLGNVAINTTVVLLLVEDFGAIGVCLGYSIASLALAIMAIIYKKRISNFKMFYKELSAYVFAAIVISIISYYLYSI